MTDDQVYRLIQKGHYLFDVKKYALCITEMQKVISFHPKHDGAWRTMALCYREMEHLNKALQCGLKSLQSDPENPTGLYLLGLIHMDKLELATAERYFLQSLQEDLEGADVHLSLAALYLARFEDEKAKEHIGHALSIDPTHSAAYHLRSQMESRQFNHEEARKLMLKAIQLDPEGATHHLSIGEIEMARGNLDGAAYHFKEAIRLDPQDEDARNKYLDARIFRRSFFRFFHSRHWFVNQLSEIGQLSITFVAALLILLLLDNKWQPGTFLQVFGKGISALILIPGLFYWIVRPIKKWTVAKGEWGSWNLSLLNSENFANLSNMLAWLALSYFLWAESFAAAAIALFLSGYGIFGCLFCLMEQQLRKKIFGMGLLMIYTAGLLSLLMHIILQDSSKLLLGIVLGGWLMLIGIYYFLKPAERSWQV